MGSHKPHFFKEIKFKNIILAFRLCISQIGEFFLFLFSRSATRYTARLECGPCQQSLALDVSVAG